MKKQYSLIFLGVFSLIFLLSFYHQVIFHPNSYLFNDSGDAIKNYFTYCYHIRYDSPLFNFEGMNYPYGENIFYTDCHPVLVVVFKLIGSAGGVINTHSIGILNFILIASIFLTFFVCYFLLKEFKLSNWMAVLFSIGMTILAPQIFRLGGHLALSYSFAIPLSWLLLIRCFNTNNIRFIALLFVNNLFWLFVHAYLGVIIIMFLALVMIAKWFSDTNKRTLILKYLKLFSVVLIPMIIFYSTVKLTDTHSGRTNNPSGFFLYNAEIDDVFIPSHPPLRTLFDSVTGGIIKQEWEALSYVGFPATIMILVIVISAIICLIKRKQSPFLKQIFSSVTLNVAIVAAGVLLFFAMAIPFKQLPGLADFIPVVKQFRATGRFTWPFYFVVMVFTATVMQWIFIRAKDQGKAFTGLLLVVLVGLINILEGLPYHAEAAAVMVKSANLFDKKQLNDTYQSAIAAVDPEKFQGILPLPFYYQGSENFARPRNDETVRASLIISYHTGIPLTAANLTRTAIWESKNIVQLASPNYYLKPIQKDIPDARPFLVVRTKDAITDYEKEIFSRCELLHQNEQISIYALKKEDLFRDEAGTVFEKYNRAKNSLHQQQEFSVSGDSTFLYHNGFENLKSEQIYKGAGGFQGVKKGKNTFAEFPPGTFESGKTYVVRLWMFNGMQDALNDWFRLIVEEDDRENEEWISTTFFPEQCEAIDENWSLAEFTFQVKNPANGISLVSIGKKYAKEPLYVDELLITEEGVNVYRFNEKDQTIFFNNHTLKIKQ